MAPPGIPPHLRPHPVLRVAPLLAAATFLLVAAAPPGPTTVTAVRVYPERDGITRIEVEASDPAVPYSYRQYSELEGSPRGVLRLRGVVEPYPDSTIPVLDCNLDRVRIGHHPELQPPELHVVLDLTEARVTVLSISRRETTLVIRLGRPDGTPTPSPTVPQASPTPPPVPTPTASPPPPPTATATATSPPPASTRRALPPPSPVAPGSTSAPRTVYRREGTAERSPASVPGSATAITEMVVSQRVDGATLLRVTTDQALQRHAILDYGDPRDPTRHVLLFLGIRAADMPTLLEVGDPNLGAVQITTAGEGRPAETQLGLVLTSSRVQVTEIATHGRHLVVVLAPKGGG